MNNIYWKLFVALIWPFRNSFKRAREKKLEFDRSLCYFEPGLQVPTMNEVMRDPEKVIETCPTAWQVTLLLKIEANLRRGHEGFSCARVRCRALGVPPRPETTSRPAHICTHARRGPFHPRK